jgi:hypothetical protein
MAIMLSAAYKGDSEAIPYCPLRYDDSEPYRAAIIKVVQKQIPGGADVVKAENWWYENGVVSRHGVFEAAVKKYANPDIEAAWWLIKSTLRTQLPIIYSPDTIRKIISFLTYYERLENENLQQWWDHITTMFSRFENGRIEVVRT